MPTIQDLTTAPNIIPLLDDECLSDVLRKVVDGHNSDLGSKSEWQRQVEEAVDMAKLKKTHRIGPFENSANIHFPMIATAALQFNARMYPEVVKSTKVVQAEIIGYDPQDQKAERAERIEKFMSWQLLDQNNEWEQGTDALFHVLPVAGTCFRKTYYDPLIQKIRSELCLPNEIIINNSAASLERAQRVGHLIDMSTNDLLEYMRAGLYVSIDPDDLKRYAEDVDYPTHKILEQHCWLDLDEDGYAEPYIVTAHLGCHKLLRINARYNPRDIRYNEKNQVVKIHPIDYFTDYHFIRSPDGTFYSLGFGTMLLPLNKTVNSLLNQLMDAGSLANAQGGFISSMLKLKNGIQQIDPRKWNVVEAIGQDIKTNIVPFESHGPSPVLFQLLGFLVEHVDRLTSVTQVLSGTEHAQNSPATTINTLVDQGLKVFTSIMRRQYWSLKKEFNKMYRLDSIFITQEQYETVLGIKAQMMQAQDGSPMLADFNQNDSSVKPVSDPNSANDAKRGQQMQLLMQLKGDQQFGPKLNDDEILKRMLQVAEIPNVEALMNVNPPAPKPDPEMMKVKIDATVESAKMEVQHQQLQRDAAKLPYEIELLKAQIEQLKSQAAANFASANVDIQAANMKRLEMAFNALHDTVMASINHNSKMQQIAAANPGPDDGTEQQAASTPMASGPDDQSSNAAPEQSQAPNGAEPPQQGQ